MVPSKSTKPSVPKTASLSMKSEASKPEAVKEAEAAAPPKPGGDKAGWKNYGENRVIGKTHDNSV